MSSAERSEGERPWGGRGEAHEVFKTYLCFTGSMVSVPPQNKMNSIHEITREIADNWNSAPVAGEEAEEFYAELHDPKTDARVLLGDQTRDPVNLTDEQWREVLTRLRVLFPRPEELCIHGWKTGKTAMFDGLCPECSDEEEDEEDLPCCGCDTPVPEHEDYGNNSTIADTCCKACWDTHLKAEGME
jgi:hypothetical protein